MFVIDVILTGTAHAQFYRHMFPPCSRNKVSQNEDNYYILFGVYVTTALLHVFTVQKNPVNTT